MVKVNKREVLYMYVFVPDGNRPITRPAPPHSFRLLAICRETGEHVLQDFKTKEGPTARKRAGEGNYSAAALFNTQGEVICGRMSAESLQTFKEMFNLDQTLSTA